MRPGLLVVVACCLLGAGPPTLTGGAGTIYLGSYGKRVVAIDEATEKPVAEMPLQTGLPWAMRPSRDGTRLYVQSADQERFEVIDVRSRRTVDTFTLGESSRRVRALAYAVDPQRNLMVAVARTTTKLSDRFEIGPPMFIRFDLTEHKVLGTMPWTADPEPRYYYLNLRFSPDGKLLYVFAHEVLIYDTTSWQQVESWNFSLPNEPGFGRFDLGSMDEDNDEPGYFTALFTMADPVQHRKLLGVGRVNLVQKNIDFFPIGPAPDRGEVSFALGADRKHGYILIQEIGRNQLWTVDIPGRRLQSRIDFTSRPRMAIRSSSNGKILYIYEAGNTIDLYEAAGFKYLRTITLDADMMYGTFYVIPPARSSPFSP